MAFLNRIADSDYLNLRHPEQRRHLAQSLRPAADIREGDLFAGSNKAGSAENVARDDREACSGGAAGQNEFPARKPMNSTAGFVCWHKASYLSRRRSFSNAPCGTSNPFPNIPPISTMYHFVWLTVAHSRKTSL